MNNHYRILTIVITAFFLMACSGKESTESMQTDSKRTANAEADNRTVPPNPKEILNAEGFIETHAISLRTEPQYSPESTHFDYVNPDAPKGGTLVNAATGSFDNFNRFALRGVSAPRSAALYDPLAVPSYDEIEILYGLIAEKFIYPPEYDWIIFKIDSRATFQDGVPITAHDVKFSFEKFMTEGVPQFREYYKEVEAVDVLDDYRVKFTLEESNKEILISLASTRILPAHFWKDKNFGEPILEPPVGSGPYIISDFKMGEYVEYKLLDTYWAMDHPVNKGTNNFEYLRYDMYRDATVKLEALKSGNIDIMFEGVSKQWATQYTGPNFDSGLIKKEELPDDSPPPIGVYYFNTERIQLADRRIRKALSLMLDFEWMNKNLFYNQYKRLRSYFQNTPFEAMGLPSNEELAILDPIKDRIPPEVFTEEYQPSKTNGSGNIRDKLAEAIELFRQVGWELNDQIMTNTVSGEPFTLEMLIYSPTDERIAIPFQENLNKLGIEMEIRMVDTTQFTARLRSRDYDMIPGSQSAYFYPDSGLKISWHSDFLDSTYNGSGVQDPAIDYLVEGISDNQDNNAELLHWGRALDRVLQWQYYTIFRWYISYDRVAWWDKFSRPEIKPKYDSGVGTWWYDPLKAEQLENR